MNPSVFNITRIGLLTRSANPLVHSTRYISGCYDSKSKSPKISYRASKENTSKQPAQKAPKQKEFKSMWETPKCDLSLAVCPPVQFDALYYKPSDKAKRKYQQTWVECPARKIKPTVICEYPHEKYPPLERRSRQSRPDTAKCLGKSDLMTCSRQKDLKQNKNCMKIALPGCRGVRSDVRCKIKRDPANCAIPRCPYPSFSDCIRPKVKPNRPTECDCLNIRSMCEVWTFLRQKAIL